MIQRNHIHNVAHDGRRVLGGVFTFTALKKLPTYIRLPLSFFLAYIPYFAKMKVGL
jgi:hypothetical protein